MFIRRRTVSINTVLTTEYIISLRTSFQNAGLKEFAIKIPHNYIKEGAKSELSLEEFLTLNRNFPSIIILARSTNNELIKLLLVNLSKKAYFNDHTFPSGHSEPSELYVATNDPVRTWGLFEYFYNELRHVSSFTEIASIVGFFFSIILLLIETILIIDRGVFWIQAQYLTTGIFDIILIVLSILILYNYFSSDKGLYVKKKSKGIPRYINLIIKGQFRDNPIFNLILSIIASIIAALIMLFLEIGSQ